MYQNTGGYPSRVLASLLLDKFRTEKRDKETRKKRNRKLPSKEKATRRERQQ